MTNKDISFSSYFVLVDDEKVTHKLFYLAFPLNTKFNKNINATNYSIDISEESDFAKLYIEFGNPLPRPEKVFNLNTQTEEDNPRTVDQYEPKQEFAVFDFKTSTLWISYSKHKSFFTDTFKEAFQTENVVLKNIYNEEDFLNAIKKVDEIRFSSTPNLFSENQTLPKEMATEMQGFGASYATLTMKFKDSGNFTEYLRKKVTALFTSKASYKSLVISGRDQNNISMIFNNDLLQKKIPIKALVNEAEVFDQNNVFSQVISWLTNDKKINK